MRIRRFHGFQSAHRVQQTRNSQSEIIIQRSHNPHIIPTHTQQARQCKTPNRNLRKHYPFFRRTTTNNGYKYAKIQQIPTTT